MKISAILLAAGEGRRLKKSVPKAFVKIHGRELFLHSLKLLEQHPQISEVVLVVPKSGISLAKKLAGEFEKVLKIVGGGKTRMESLAAGLKFTKNKFILSHNTANPFLSSREISDCLNFIPKWKAVGVGRRASSTIRFSTNSKKKIGEISGGNSQTLDREKIWLMETPQIVEKKILEMGIRLARKNKIEVTDELQLAELAGVSTKVVAASANNFKITRPEDLNKFSMCNLQCAMRIGLGADSHRFAKTQKVLFLGGVKISAAGGLEANSDGDVILHALTNAISSALGDGSLSNFADEMCQRGIRDSKKYLATVFKKMKNEGFEIENLAISIEGKRPKLEKHFPKIRKSMNRLLGIDSKKIGLTVTSGEGLTAFGRGEGIQVFAIALLKKIRQGD